MAKKKVSTIIIESVNGTRFPEPLVFPVYYEELFFVYLNEELIAFAKPEEVKIRIKTRNERERIFATASEAELKSSLRRIVTDYYSSSVREERIIYYTIKFNTRNPSIRDNTPFGSISFANTPAISLHWNIAYLITLPDGRQKIFSHPYKGYGSIVSPKFDRNIKDFKEQWMLWSEEAEAFFKKLEDSMEKLISQVAEFIGSDSKLLESRIFNGLMIEPPKTQQ